MSPYGHLKQLFNDMDVRSMGRPLLLSTLVGVVAGLGAIAFSTGVHWCDEVFLKGIAGFHPPKEGQIMLGAEPISSLAMSHSWLLFLIPVIGGLVSGFLVSNLPPRPKGMAPTPPSTPFTTRGDRSAAGCR
jgi:CIC family chloride channel protein